MRHSGMIRITARIILLFSAVLFSLTLLFSSEGGTDIHPFVRDDSSCRKCHENKAFEAPEKACGRYCQTCHKKIAESHHPIDIRLKKESEFDLTESGRITCRTCHDLKQKRFDVTSWRAESLYEKIFAKKDRYMTYFLKARNTNGELCKKCH